MRYSRSRGFTLIELLVALVVLAIMSVAGFRGLNAVLDARKTVAQETRKWQNLMFLFSRMEQDIALAVRRPVRDQNGVSQPEWIGHKVPVSADDAQLILTRAGSTDEQSLQVGPQRIGYRLDRGTIYLLRWMVLDQPMHAEPRRYPLLEGVNDLSFRYLATDGRWNEQWPRPPQKGGIPVAVEVKLTLVGGQIITRLFVSQ